MDENADAGQAIFEPPPENWRRPPGRPCTTWMKNVHDDLSLLDLGIHEARDLVQNRPLCRLAWLALLSTLALEENFCGTWFFYRLLAVAVVQCQSTSGNKMNCPLAEKITLCFHCLCNELLTCESFAHGCLSAISFLLFFCSTSISIMWQLVAPISWRSVDLVTHLNNNGCGFCYSTPDSGAE